MKSLIARTPVRLAAFAVGLAAVFAAALGAGDAFGPRVDPPATQAHADGEGMSGGSMGGGSAGEPGADGDDHGEDTGEQAGGGDGEEHGAVAEEPKGLRVSRDGYTLVPLTTRVDAAPAGGTGYEFRIIGSDGRPVTRYTETHEKDLHLIVVRRDMAGFEHVHPTLGADGTWRVPLGLSAGAGTYRVFADFQAAGMKDAITLGTDLDVAGAFAPQPLPAEAASSTVDGYTVTLRGSLRAGKSNPVELQVTRDGKPVTDLQPYLGAYGHLVALRQGDLAYLHVHPEGEPGDGKTAAGPGVGFQVEVPTAGTYRLFLDFKHGGTVRTAAFTVHAD